MGLSVGNLAVKTERRSAVIKHVESYKKSEYSQLSFYISNALGGYVCVFPSDEFRQATRLASYLSQKLDTFTFSGCVYDSDSLEFSAYDGGDRLMLYRKEDIDEPLLKGDINKLLEKVPLANDYSCADLKETFTSPYTFEEDRYENILKLFNLPVFLRDWGYRYLRREDEEGRFDLLVEEGIFSEET